MTQKKLQKDSDFDQYDMDGDGVVTDEELEPWVTIERIEALSDISNLFYISGAGIVGAYMGTTAWMSRK